MKKQAKPEVFLDHYLSTLGLWRKPVARDGLSLFRAVSEQVCLIAFERKSVYRTDLIFFYRNVVILLKSAVYLCKLS